MTLTAAVGHAQALDGREAGLQAAHQALNRLGASAPTFGIVIASHQYQPREVAAGVASLTSDMPLIGLSAPAGLTHEGIHPHSVVVALLSGDLRAEVHWLPGYSQSGRETANRLAQLTSSEAARQSLLFFADGFNGDAEQLCDSLPGKSARSMGGLSSGDLQTGSNYQIAGTQAGTGGLAAAILRGAAKIGIGFAHGWDPVGSQLRVTRSRGFWLRALDGRPASETYAQIFGYPARDWAFPPLNYLARLYPLGLEQGEQLIVRAPLRVEADGSFRMNAPIRDGLDAYLLVGSRASCQAAAQKATQQAMLQLDEAKPVFALVLVDLAWQMLLKSTPGAEIAAVQDILGPNVPIAGGYTLGQIAPGKDTPQFLNQHILVIVFGEEKS
ncbi:MAG: hypothetical protein COS37_02890 [Anaerolineae bacterium CG03_land_8_20_14_0_80_58_20]|nr:MAG: hypothetical protein COS37_02890 [Anaerolineae bacterium CG03_land_8_20_14_0_80_58_20]